MGRGDSLPMTPLIAVHSVACQTRTEAGTMDLPPIFPGGPDTAPLPAGAGWNLVQASGYVKTKKSPIH